MAALMGRIAETSTSVERQERAAREGNSKLLDFNGLGYGQGIFKFEAEVSGPIVYLGVA